MTFTKLDAPIDRASPWHTHCSWALMRHRLLAVLAFTLGFGIVARAWLLDQPLAAGLATLAANGTTPDTSSARPASPVVARFVPPPIVPVVTTNAAVSKRASPKFSGARNLLIVGIDRRGARQHGGRPDTLIVAMFSGTKLGLLSVPRDLLVEVPKWGPDRINASFAAARRAKKPPLEFLQRVVEDTLKVPIEHTLAIDLSGFEQAVNALGGIEVDVRCPIIDDFVDPRSPTGRRRLNVPAGRQVMDGITAAMYVRSRHGRSDWSRARRQQAVLFAIRERATSLGGLARLPGFLNQLDELLITDMTGSELLELARLGLTIEPGHIHGLVLGHRQTEPHLTADGKAVLLPKHDAIRRALDTLLSAAPPGALPKNAQCPPADVALGRKKTHSPAAAEEPTG